MSYSWSDDDAGYWVVCIIVVVTVRLDLHMHIGPSREAVVMYMCCRYSASAEGVTRNAVLLTRCRCLSEI
jgi:hypothetical protein